METSGLQINGLNGLQTIEIFHAIPIKVIIPCVMEQKCINKYELSVT